ncbi:MAG: hypothetical protein LBU98_06325, partial [Alistipes sp.]|nr:hypothetical protein [Alistipes sp.]
MNRPKLTGADKVKYQIHDEIAANLPKCRTFIGLEQRLRQAGVTVQYKYRRGTVESPENIQGVSFEKDGITFKGSDIDRKFSHANLKKSRSANLNEAWQKIKDEWISQLSPHKKLSRYFVKVPELVYRHIIQSFVSSDFVVPY